MLAVWTCSSHSPRHPTSAALNCLTVVQNKERGTEGPGSWTPSGLDLLEGQEQPLLTAARYLLFFLGFVLKPALMV